VQIKGVISISKLVHIRQTVWF